MAASPRPGDAGSLAPVPAVARSLAPVVGQEVGRRGGGGSGRPGSRDEGEAADRAGQELETGGVRTPIPSHIDLAGNTSYHFAASRTVFPRVSPYHGPGPFAPFGSRI